MHTPESAFRVVIDTREQKPYLFLNIPADRRELKGIPDLPGIVGTLSVPVVVSSIKSGDYSIEGFEDTVAIERKSKSDLFSTISQGRDRFEREIARLNDLNASVTNAKIGAKGFAAIVVEAELSEIIRDPPKQCQLKPKTILRSVMAWQQRFPRVHWWFAPGRDAAEIIVYRILDRWWRDNVEENPNHEE